MLVMASASSELRTAQPMRKPVMAYIFEPEDYWVTMLRKTYGRFGDKVEIVPGMVGDKEGQIKLDEFFANRRIDVEERHIVIR